MSRRSGDGVEYMIRNVPPELWRAFNERATANGWLGRRSLILQLLRDYADGKIQPSAPPPPMRQGDREP